MIRPGPPCASRGDSQVTSMTDMHPIVATKTGGSPSRGVHSTCLSTLPDSIGTADRNEPDLNAPSPTHRSSTVPQPANHRGTHMQTSLSVALEQHRRGELVQAARHYRTILEDAPSTPTPCTCSAWSHQQGDPLRAVDLIGRAIALDPARPPSTPTWPRPTALGRHERAVAAARPPCGSSPIPRGGQQPGPGLPGPRPDRGGGRPVPRGDPAPARLRHGPQQPGQRPLACGDPDRALDHFRRAVELDPDQAEAHSNLGQMLLERTAGRRPSTTVCQAVRLRPDFPEARNNLGNVLRELGRLGGGEGLLRRGARSSTRTWPSPPTTWARPCRKRAGLDEALAWYRRGLRAGAELGPDPLPTWPACSRNGEIIEEAIAATRPRSRLDPGLPEAHHGLGWVLHDRGRFEEALALLTGEALRLRPDYALAHCSLGTLLEELGDLDGGPERCFREALRRDPDHAGAHAQLATLLRGKLPEADLAAMPGRLSTDPDLSDGKRSALHFGLAQVLDARGDYATAAEHLRRANALALAGPPQARPGLRPGRGARPVRGGADRDLHARVLRGGCAASGSESERPVFIVGPAAVRHHADRAGPGQPLAGLRGRRAAPGARGVRCPARDARHDAGAGFACLGRLDASGHRTARAGPTSSDSTALDATADAGRRQDAGQLPVPGPAGDAVPQGEVHPLPARPARRGRLVLDDQLPPDPLGQRPRAHRRPLSRPIDG